MMSEPTHTEKLTDISISAGVRSEFAKLCEKGDDPLEVLKCRVEYVIDMYDNNKMQHMWMRQDVIALHVIVVNRLLALVDVNDAISHVKAWEDVLSRLPEIVCGWVKATKYALYNESVQECVDCGYTDTLCEALCEICKYIESPPKEPLSCPWASFLADIATDCVQHEQKPGWALVRIESALATIRNSSAGGGEVEDTCPSPTPK